MIITERPVAFATCKSSDHWFNKITTGQCQACGTQMLMELEREDDEDRPNEAFEADNESQVERDMEDDPSHEVARDNAEAVEAAERSSHDE